MWCKWWRTFKAQRHVSHRDFKCICWKMYFNCPFRKIYFSWLHKFLNEITCEGKTVNNQIINLVICKRTYIFIFVYGFRNECNSNEISDVSTVTNCYIFVKKWSVRLEFIICCTFFSFYSTLTMSQEV